MQETYQLSIEKTILLPTTRPTRQRNLFKSAFSLIVALAGISAIFCIYFALPMMELFSFTQDWMTELLCALCIFIFVEGLIGLVLLSIARSMRFNRATYLEGVQHVGEEQVLPSIEEQVTMHLLPAVEFAIPTQPLTIVK